MEHSFLAFSLRRWTAMSRQTEGAAEPTGLAHPLVAVQALVCHHLLVVGYTLHRREYTSGLPKNSEARETTTSFFTSKSNATMVKAQRSTTQSQKVILIISTALPS